MIEGERLLNRPRADHVPEAPKSSVIPGRWVDAADLVLGDALLLRGGRTARVSRVVKRQVELPVYNFHVDELQCYAVGNSGILVHNDSVQEQVDKAGGFFGALGRMLNPMNLIGGGQETGRTLGSASGADFTDRQAASARRIQEMEHGQYSGRLRGGSAIAPVEQSQKDALAAVAETGISAEAAVAGMAAEGASGGGLMRGKSVPESGPRGGPRHANKVPEAPNPAVAQKQAAAAAAVPEPTGAPVPVSSKPVAAGERVGGGTSAPRNQSGGGGGGSPAPQKPKAEGPSKPPEIKPPEMVTEMDAKTKTYRDSNGQLRNFDGSAVDEGATKRGAHPETQKRASLGSTLHSDKPGNLPEQLRKRYPNTEFEMTKPGEAGQDVKYKSGKHPSEYEGSTWPEGVDHGDFKPDTEGGRKTFRSDQRNKWKDPTHMLPYDPQTGNLK